MTSKQFATVGIRLVGLIAIAFGVVFAGSNGIMRALGMGSLTSTSTSDSQLHDTYYVISYIENAWFAPGVISAVIGILSLVFSRRLGTWLARGTEPET